MRPIAFSAATVEAVLRRLGVATVPQLVEALGRPSKRTVYRRLRELDTLSSYTHNGQYHALRDSASFDESGIWYMARSASRCMAPCAPPWLR